MSLTEHKNVLFQFLFSWNRNLHLLLPLETFLCFLTEIEKQGNVENNLQVLLWEVAKKVIFLMAVPLRPYIPPPPLSLMTVGTFFYILVLKCLKRVLAIFFLPPIFGQKELYFLATIVKKEKYLLINFNVICPYADKSNLFLF